MRTSALWFILALASALLVQAHGASAHPHVWVTAKAEIVYEKGQIAAIQHHWTFDEFYTAQAIEGLDKNGDGIYSREELAELAQVNMQGLKEFEYFTYATRGKERVAMAEPVDPWLEHKAGLLTLHFRLPLAKPLPGDVKGFSLAVYDPSFFIAFEMAKDAPFALVGAPAGCKITFGAAVETETSEQSNGSVFGSPATKAGYVTCGPGHEGPK